MTCFTTKSCSIAFASFVIIQLHVPNSGDLVHVNVSFPPVMRSRYPRTDMVVS